ncbi:MAG: hypothetical protein WCY19_03460 [Candidatus Gastranaerophilaceae bacterium]
MLTNRILPYDKLPEPRQILPPLTGRMVRVEKDVYTDASRILGVIANKEDSRFVSVHRQISNGAILETNIMGNLKRIADKISRAKTTSGKAIDLLPLTERMADSIRNFARTIKSMFRFRA